MRQSRPQKGELTVPGPPCRQETVRGWGPGLAPYTVALQHSAQAFVTCSISTSWEAKKG